MINSEIIEFKESKLKITLFFAVILIALFAFLDETLYPEKFSLLAFSRIIVNSVLLLLLILMRNNITNTDRTAFFATLSILIAINIIVFIVSNLGLSYYAGLNLVLVLYSTILSSKTSCTFLISLLTVTSCFLTITLYAKYRNTVALSTTLFCNMTFIILTAIFCTLGDYYNLRLRNISNKNQGL